MKAQKVVVGLSGGVDSSVAAFLLKQQGYEVIGIFMRNWNDESTILNEECPWVEDSNDALLVAEKLGIPFQVMDMSVEYKARIVDYMFAEYEAGRTPNPDVLCNREVKFDLFLKLALSIGADFVATGHYSQKKEIEINNKKTYSLIAGNDSNKDQSYFLCQINQYQLSKALFPIGHLQKSEVRAIAMEQGLITAEKKDSQGLCFIGKIKLPDFLQQQLKAKSGDIIEIPENSDLYKHEKKIDFNEHYTLNELLEFCSAIHYNKHDGIWRGKHEGAHFYTIGQRKGLQVGGSPKPLFVIYTDIAQNIVYVGQGESHLGLNRQGLYIENKNVHWVRPDLKMFENDVKPFQVRIRYRQKLENAKLIQQKEKLFILFENKQKGIAKGQFAAWYLGDELIGSGIIS
jgi:tRNA-specific 2-thiouridylase